MTTTMSWTTMISLDNPAAAAEVNPVTEFPVLSWPLGLIDSLAIDLGMPLWLREMVELAVLGIILWTILRLLSGRALPWLGSIGVAPLLLLVGVLRNLLLLPDLAVTIALGRLRRRPPAIVYAYGDAVLAAADGLEAIGRKVLSVGESAHRIPRALLLMVLAGTFLLWNDQHCVATPDDICQSPVHHWTATTGAWFDSRGGGTP